MSRLRTLGYVLVGAAIAVLGMFVPVIRWGGPALGGAVAGYAHDEGPRGGGAVGLGVAAVAIAAFVLFGVAAFAVLALVGLAAADPEAADAALGLGGLIAAIWVVVVPLVTLAGAPAGGVLGGYLADQRDGDEPAGAGGGDPAEAWPGVATDGHGSADDPVDDATAAPAVGEATPRGAGPQATAGAGRAGETDQGRAVEASPERPDETAPDVDETAERDESAPGDADDDGIAWE